MFMSVCLFVCLLHCLLVCVLDELCINSTGTATNHSEYTVVVYGETEELSMWVNETISPNWSAGLVWQSRDYL